MRGQPCQNVPNQRLSRLDLLLGIEYGGWKDTTISIEVADRHIIGHQEGLEAAPDAVEAHEPQLVLRFSRDFRNETLNLGVLDSYWSFNAENGGLQRYTATYDISDAFKVRMGFTPTNRGNRAN